MLILPTPSYTSLSCLHCLFKALTLRVCITKFVISRREMAIYSLYFYVWAMTYLVDVFFVFILVKPKSRHPCINIDVNKRRLLNLFCNVLQAFVRLFIINCKGYVLLNCANDCFFVVRALLKKQESAFVIPASRNLSASSINTTPKYSTFGL